MKNPTVALDERTIFKFYFPLRIETLTVTRHRAHSVDERAVRVEVLQQERVVVGGGRGDAAKLVAIDVSADADDENVHSGRFQVGGGQMRQDTNVGASVCQQNDDSRHSVRERTNSVIRPEHLAVGDLESWAGGRVPPNIADSSERVLERSFVGVRAKREHALDVRAEAHRRHPRRVGRDREVVDDLVDEVQLLAEVMLSDTPRRVEKKGQVDCCTAH